MSETKEYECNKCKKVYSSYHGLYGHVKKSDKCNKHYEKNELSISKSFTTKTENNVEQLEEPQYQPEESQIEPQQQIEEQPPVQSEESPIEEPQQQIIIEESKSLFECRSPIQNVSSASEETDSEQSTSHSYTESIEFQSKYNKLYDKYKRVLFVNKTLRTNEIKLKNLMIDIQSKYNQTLQKELKSLHEKDDQIKELNDDIKKLKDDKKIMYDKYKIVLDELDQEKRKIEDDYYSMKKKNKQLEAEVEELREIKELYEQMQEEQLAEEDGEDIEDSYSDNSDESD